MDNKLDVIIHFKNYEEFRTKHPAPITIVNCIGDTKELRNHEELELYQKEGNLYQFTNPGISTR
jgi:hypothetical protein